MEIRTPLPREFFRARGAVWMALGRPFDAGRRVGVVLRAARVAWLELPCREADEVELVLCTGQYVRAIDVDGVLDAYEAMGAHLRQWVRGPQLLPEEMRERRRYAASAV